MAASNSIWKLLIFYSMFFPSVQCISISGACFVGKCSSYILFSINNKPNYVWLDYGHGLLIFLLSTQIWLSAAGHIWGFQAFLGECMEGMAWRLNSGQGLLIFLLLMPLWLSGTGQIGDFGAFPEKKNALREWPKILHDDGSWPATELIKLWSRYGDFLFWLHFHLVKRVKFGVSGYFLVHMKGMAWDLCMLMYPDYLQTWLDHCYVLLIFIL